MSDEKFQNKYRIKSARATWHDYGGGAYFITVCAKHHSHFFGEIDNGIVQLSSIGQFLNEKIQDITNRCPYAEIPLFVVMPNHWHAIVFVDGDETPYIRRDVNFINNNEICPVARSSIHLAGNVFPTVETRHATSLLHSEQMQNIANMQGWLSVSIGGIKSAVTKYANENDIDFAWQTRFHDHIIRNRNEMNRIADYIENNPATWDTDCFNENNK